MTRPRLGDVLVENHVLNVDQRNAALAVQRKTGQKLAEILVELGFVTEEDVIVAMVEHFGVQHVRVSNYIISPNAVNAVDQRTCRLHTLIPLSQIGKTVVLAMADPLDLEAIDAVERLTKLKVETVISTKSDILHAIDKWYAPLGQDALLEELDVGGHGTSAEDLKAGEASTPDIDIAIRATESLDGALNRILLSAVEKNASDIHIEPLEDEVRIRYRIDGKLNAADCPISASTHKAFMARVRSRFQDRWSRQNTLHNQRIDVTVRGRHVTFAVSIVATCLGQRAHLRRLDLCDHGCDIKDLGFKGPQLEKLLAAIRRAQGMVLVTGPRDAGKTTTIYSLLSLLNEPGVNIMTAEPLVKRSFRGINQMEWNPAGSDTFADLVRCLLSQDPDILMVGQMEDEETVDVAMRAAQAGYLVLGALHAACAIRGIARLAELGCPPTMMASSLIACTSQRLLRTLCNRCKEPWEPATSELTEWAIHMDPREKVRIFRPKGCGACMRGYRGRTGAMEILSVEGDVQEMMMRVRDVREIERAARDAGMTSIRENAMAKVLLGLTTREEVLRATAD